MNLSEQTEREQTTTRLIEAITQEHFILYGQPIIPVSAPKESAGYIEVLVRYVEEEKRLLPPGGFFEVLESLNLMSVLDRWVINRVVRSLVGQHDAQRDWNVPRYSVNLSVDTLYEAEFCRLVAEYFRKYRLPPDKVRFEIDESDAQVHAVELAKVTSNLSLIGCGFTLTSYTGDLVPPSSLQALRVDAVKMDGKALTDPNPAVSSRSKGRAIYSMCRNLGIRIIAEMVEDPQTLDKLKQIGVDYAQGYAIGRPAPLQTVINSLK